MLFNSIQFAIFLPIVFTIYWLLAKHVKWQNTLLLLASYFFYAWWDWRFLSLVLLCSITNFLGGLGLMKVEKQKTRKMILTLCCVISLGVLGLFKYYDFFADSLMHLFTPPHTDISIINIKLLHLILPVGISFYTFHTLSYTIDVYRRKFEPTKDVVSFFLFVSIFPLAMAGPIERATNLLPQIYKRRAFDYDMAVDGMRQILWGLFKKVVVADNCAVYANQIFDTYQTQSGGTLLMGAIFFAFQIYGDFSGYSDMAIGIGKLLGFRFLNNFHFPYFSRDIAEFWRRWHISLTTWFRDYLYIPLGGSRGSKAMIVRNTFIIFLVSGFWHGANWTFIAWGAYHAVLFLPLILLGRNRKYTNTVAERKLLPSIKEFLQMLLTFVLVLIGWIFFRAETIHKAVQILRHIGSKSILNLNLHLGVGAIGGTTYIALFINILILFIVEWLQRKKEYGLEISQINPWLRRLAYLFIIFNIICFKGESAKFIYFQF